MAIKFIQIMISLGTFSVLCYVAVWLIIMDRLRNVAANKKELRVAEQKLLNSKQATTVGSVGTARVAEPVPVSRYCRGCGRPAYLHEDEADFNYCNRKANRL